MSEVMKGYDLSDVMSIIPVTTRFGERVWHKWRVWYEEPMDCTECGSPSSEPGEWSASNGLRFKTFPTCAEAWAWIESGPPPLENSKPWGAVEWPAWAEAAR